LKILSLFCLFYCGN